MSLRNAIIFQIIIPFSLVVIGYYYLNTIQYSDGYNILRLVFLSLIGSFLGLYLFYRIDQQEKILNTSSEEEAELYGLIRLPKALLFDFGYKLSTIFGILFSSMTKTDNYAPIIEYQTQFNHNQGESQIGTYYLCCYEIPMDQAWCSLSKYHQKHHMKQIKQYIMNVQQVLQKQIPGVKFRFLTRSELLEEHGFNGDIIWDELPPSDFIYLGKLKVTRYNSDVLLITKISPENPKAKEQVLLSIIGVTTDLKDNFQLLNRVPEGHEGVSTWRWNRVETQNKKGWLYFRKVFTTQNYIIIKSSLQEVDSFFQQTLEYIYEQLLETRKDVLSFAKNGFKCTDIKKEDLIQVYLHKKPVETGKGKVKYDQAYLRAIAQLTRVPSRMIPMLPCSTVPVTIPLGTNFINPERIIGFKELSKLIVYCGSDHEYLIGALQHLIKTIATPERKIIIIDFDNDLGSLSNILSRRKKDIPIEILQLGNNFSFNLYDVEIPSHISNRNSQTTYQMNTVVQMLAYASETDELLTNLAQLRHAMIEVAKKINPKGSHEALSLQKITSSEVFTDVFRTTDHLTMDRLGRELEYYSASPEFNDGKKYSDVINNLGQTPGITLIKFPTQTYAHKRLAFVFLLQKLATHCDAQTVIVVTHASKLFGKENEDRQRFFEDTINQPYTKIHHSGCLVLVTHSVTALHPEIQKDITTGVFFRLLNAEDRDWLSVRYALETKLADNVPNVSAFLKGLQQEALLFREDNIYTCDHFVPFILDSIESNDNGEDGSSSPCSDPVALEETQFTLLMTVLGHIQNQAMTEYTMIQYLRDLGYTNIMTDWENVCKLPFVNLSENDNNRIVSISNEGRTYYSHITTLIQQLPPPIALDSRTIDSTLRDLRNRVNQSYHNDPMEHHQLKRLIGEIAGALLNEYLRVQGVTDWSLVKKYIDLLEIEGNHHDHHNQRFALLELLYTQIENNLQINSPSED